jgi:hypothetical protein
MSEMPEVNVTYKKCKCGNGSWYRMIRDTGLYTYEVLVCTNRQCKYEEMIKP